MYKKIKSEITQPDIIMYKDIVYSNQFNDFLQESIPLSLHLLRPFYEIKSWKKRPLLVWIGGGAFRNSTPASCIPQLTEYAKRGYVVASIGYRVSSDSHFPSQVQDVKAAVRFLKTHHETYGIDPDRIVVAGHSAGAYLAAMIGATEGVELFETDEWREASSSVKGVVCMSGGDFLMQNKEENKRPLLPLELFLGYNFVDDWERGKAASISHYLNDNTPPFMLIHGENDDTIPVNSSRLLYRALTNAGVEADFYEIQGAGHATAELWQPDIQNIMFEFFERVLQA